MAEEENSIVSEDPDTDSYEHSLEITRFLREPAIPLAIQALQLPPGSRGLDAGCGIGLDTVLLAEAVAPDGHVTGLDLSPSFLARASEIAKTSGLSERISFQEGNVNNIPFDDKTFDWAWSANCVGYAPGEPLPLIKELIRVVKPGGIVAIIVWSSQQLLPGHPVLEARLNATSAGIAPFIKGIKPQRHFLRALGWFHDAGMEEPTARTFVGDAHAPLSNDMLSALASLIDMRWPGVESELTKEDQAEYQRLCQPESPDFILNLPDYYAFFTYSMFSGKVAR